MKHYFKFSKKSAQRKQTVRKNKCKESLSELNKELMSIFYG